MINTFKRGLVIVFVLVALSLLLWFKINQPRILIIQSYETDYAWTRDVDSGLKRVLGDTLRYKIQWYYMDTKKHPSEKFKIRAGKLAIQDIESFRPDVIIAIDDDAQRYALYSYANNPKVNIVFAGVNGSVKSYGYYATSNVTGIYERIPLEALRAALDAMRDAKGLPLGRRIVAIGDNSGPVKDDSKLIEAMDWRPFKLVDSIHASNYDEWKQAVVNGGREGDMILLSNYQNVARYAGQEELLVPPKEIMEWTKKYSTVPVIETGGWMFQDGGMLAIGSSGFEQGQVSAQLATYFLDHKTAQKNNFSDILCSETAKKHFTDIQCNDSVQKIPYVMPHQFLVYMHQSAMRERGLELPAIYEEFARATNNYH
jgi:hypothetical protein